jgi:acetyltransferase-like isoleucine patch superfamily enzyme/coenzyme F420-reducing hydrogenase beta subunit
MKNSYLFDTNKEFCSGCRACEFVCARHKAITMTEDSEGFLYPVIDSAKCINCKLCEKYCPMTLENEVKTDTNFDAEIYGVWAKDNMIAKESATSGICTIISEYIIEQNGIVFGVQLNEDKQCAEHIVITDKRDLPLIKGSKYIQSDTGNRFKETETYLKESRLVSFIGTPCQIAGLKSYLKRDYENLITIDLICHGVFSKKIYQKELSYLKKIWGEEISNLKFRSKKVYPWTMGGIVNFDVKKNGKTKHVEIPAKFSPMYHAFAYSEDGANYTLRPACYNCKFRVMDRVSDIMVGDFWGMQKYHSKYNTVERRKYGVSLVSVNTIKGKDIFCKINDRIEFFLTDREKAAQQPALLGGKRSIPLKRELIYENLDKMDYGTLSKNIIFPHADFDFEKNMNRYIRQFKFSELKYRLPFASELQKFKSELGVWKRSIEELFLNGILPLLPSRHLRYFFLRNIFKAKIGKKVSMYHSIEFRNPAGLTIEGNNSIGMHVLLDARKGLTIKKGAVIASHVLLWTLHHDYNSADFRTVGAPTEVGEYAWICSRAIILPGVKIGKGAVVASGAVVTKDVESFTVVGGIPAKKIGMRKEMEYNYSTCNKYHII